VSTWRCAGCREYKRGVPYRRLGLGSVCSEQCLRAVATRKSTKAPAPPPDVPENVRAAVLARDRKRCRFCGTTEGLHEHHVIYRSQGGPHEAANLITLCASHHALVHTDKGRWQPVLLAYIYNAEQGRHRQLLELDRAINGC
jgi:5-methylcytosine-specific restriction endonuclease McrA